MNYLIVPIMASAFLLAVQCLDYQNLQSTGASCPQRDSCTFAGDAVFNDRNCECDSRCVLFRDCCIDARTTPRISRFTTECVGYNREVMGAYMVAYCPRSYHGGGEVRSRCLGNDYSDPLAAAPVTDMVDGVTYKNRYCAECNAAVVGRLKSWLITVDCESCESNLNRALVWRNLRYDPILKTWGVDLQRQFHPFEVIFDKPSYVTARRCRPNIVSHCPRGSTNQTLGRLCESYAAVTESDHVLYKNPHCVMCNHPGAAMSCYTGEGINSRKKPFSFALLLDVNESDGTRVGMTNPCPTGQKYDPFFKKCRKVVCAIPGYVKADGKCVKKNTGGTTTNAATTTRRGQMH